MTCPHCDSGDTNRRRWRTSLGYRTFACRACRRVFNERSGTAFNDLQYPTDVVLLAVLRRLRDTLSCRDIAAMLLERGCSVTPETIREWACRFAPLVTARLRAKRRGRAGRAWSLDETDVQVAARWCSLDRAIDREGDLLDSRRSAHRDQHDVRRVVEVIERCARPGVPDSPAGATREGAVAECGTPPPPAGLSGATVGTDHKQSSPGRW